MNEYALYGRGNTIHASCQVEHYKNEVHDKAKSLGGKQSIDFLDGYSCPLECENGLMYLRFVGKPSLADMDKYPHIIMTSPHPWDPAIIDSNHSSDNGTPPWAGDPHRKDDFDPRFNDFGLYNHREINNLNF